MIIMRNFFKQSFIKALLIILGIWLGFYFWGLKEERQFLISFQNNIPTVIKTSPKNINHKINILFLGVPGNGYRGALLTDTIFVIHLNIQNKKVAVVSIPRDLLVKNNLNNSQVKINSLYAIENPSAKYFIKAQKYNLIKNKIQDILGMEINYIVIFDLTGFSKLVDTVGGVSVWLEKEIIDPHFSDPYNANDIFKLEPGWHNLDGKSAIKFVRSRYDPQGDFYRMKHQQQIIASLKDKITHLSEFYNLLDWLKLWQSLDGHFITDLDLNTALNFFKMFKNVKSEEIVYLSFTTREPDKMLVSSSYLEIDPQTKEPKNIYVLIPKAGFENYTEIQNYLKEKIND